MGKMDTSGYLIMIRPLVQSISSISKVMIIMTIIINMMGAVEMVQNMDMVAR